jgi:hypothetical protein
MVTAVEPIANIPLSIATLNHSTVELAAQPGRRFVVRDPVARCLHASVVGQLTVSWVYIPAA